MDTSPRPSTNSNMDTSNPSTAHSLRESKSVDVIEAASKLLSRPFRSSSPSEQTDDTYTASTRGQTPTQRSKVALIPPARIAKPTYAANENEVPDDWRDALKNSRVTVWDGYALARNNDTGEFRLVEKNRESPDQSPTSPDDINEKGFNVKYPSSFSNSDGTTPPSSSSGSAEPPPPEIRMSKIHEIAFVVNVCLAQFLSLGGLSQTIAPGFIIGVSLGADYAKLSLATAAYGMALGTLILPAGRLGDMFGHKRIFILGWLWFALWSLFCGFSDYRGYTMLVAGRAMQGIGPALTVPNGIALVGRTFPLGLKRNFSISVFGGMGPIGMVVGSSFSALCAEKGWWQWSFWALSITSVLISLLSLLIIPADSRQHMASSTNLPKPRWWVKFDLPGAITGIAGLVMINFAFNEAPIVGWHRSYIPFILVLGLISFAIFIYIELRVASHPLIPLKGLTREAAFVLACIACGWGSHGIWVVGYFVFQTRFRHLTPLTAVAEKVPVAPIGLACAMGVAFVLRRVRVAWVMFAAMLAFLVGTLFLATAPVGQSYFLNTFFSIIIMPLAMNWSYPAGSVLMSNAVPRESQGIAASLISTMVNYSISLGLGMAGSVERYVGDRDGALEGWRAGLWFGVALDAVGLVISAYFIWKTRAGKK
ncbi:hypothetical protein Q7P37_000109 [Cladosporium fusiforme]